MTVVMTGRILSLRAIYYYLLYKYSWGDISYEQSLRGIKQVHKLMQRSV